MVNADAVDILLVEDNPHDLALALRALEKRHLANKVVVARDGAEALDFIFGTGAYADRDVTERPKVVQRRLRGWYRPRSVLQAY